MDGRNYASSDPLVPGTYSDCQKQNSSDGSVSVVVLANEELEIFELLVCHVLAP
jgi:hypothetical protein